MKLDLRDGLAAAGLVLVAAGVGFIYWPLALIVIGAVLMSLALWRVGGGTH